MLVENVNMIQVTSVEERSSHLHKSVELIYVLTGNVEITIQGEIFRASPMDLILINAEELHSWKGIRDALICKVYMDYYALRNALKMEHISFSCNSVQDPEKDCTRLRYILGAILRKYADAPDSFQVKSMYYSLWEVLINQYLDQKGSTADDREISGKIKEVTEYIYKNYNQPLNLAEMAARWFMSDSSFSRFFKRETGKGFAEYVRDVRLERAKEELLFTNKPITDISFDSGFTSISVFNKNFKQAFSLTPKEFRQVGKSPVSGGLESDMTGLVQYLQNARLEKRTLEAQGLEICVDMERSALFQDAVLSCINAGMFADLLAAKMQKHISIVIRNLGVKYIRVSNPFDPKMKIRSDHQTKRMNFEKIDTVLDFLLDQGVVPVFELPERQKKMIASIGSNKILEEIRTDPLFLSMEEWEQALSSLMEHFVDRYSIQEVNRWMFEIWYDVEHVTGAGKLPYKVLYERTWKIIRKYAPLSLIGGSGLNTVMDRDELKNQLNWWKNRLERPDFLTFISYPYQVERRDEQEKGNLYNLLSIDSDDHFVRRDLNAYRALLEEVGYPDTPVWVSEWNTSLSERNIYNDSCAKACHMLTQMVDVTGDLAQMNYSGISDCPAQYFDSAVPLTGATGLITKDGLMKPAYYALEFWGMLGERLLKKGNHYIITSRYGDTIQILAFNAKKFNYEYYLKDEDYIDASELPFVFQNSDKLELSFKLLNVRNGRRKVCMYNVRESSGNVLAEWIRLGASENLTRTEVSYLGKICIPRMEIRYEEVSQRVLNLDVKLEANEMIFIQIL